MNAFIKINVQNKPIKKTPIRKYKTRQRGPGSIPGRTTFAAKMQARRKGETNMSNYTPKNKTYRADALKAAKELGYGDEVIRRIKNAKTDGEIERIMVTARRSMR